MLGGPAHQAVLHSRGRARAHQASAVPRAAARYFLGSRNRFGKSSAPGTTAYFDRSVTSAFTQNESGTGSARSRSRS
jgi:hypothetical protein